MAIEWNKVTWYSKLVAVILFVVVFYLGFYLGAEFSQVNTELERNSTTQSQY